MSKRICALIDTGAIKNNLMEIRKRIGERKLIAVIKADAYGHGAKETAPVIEEFCDMFAVASYDEAEEIRKTGVKKQILILGPVPEEDIALCIKDGFLITVSSLKEAERISFVANEIGTKAVIHIAVDTGMRRIGFKSDEMGIEEIKKVCVLPMLSPEGIFSHYATADEKDKSFTKLQTERFKKVCAEVGHKFKMHHIANSAAIIDDDELYGDAVRAGIIIYGHLPSSDVSENTLALKKALTWKSRVSFVKEVDEDEGISYGLTFKSPHKMTVATVSAGYGDGYSRLFSNRGEVIIRGRRFPIVGRVCMDQFMVDVTGYSVEVDDEVILIGQGENEYIGAEELAKLSNTISYETICGIGRRVPRIYK